MQGFIAPWWEAIKVLDEGERVDEGGVWGGWRRSGESGGHAWTQPDPVTGGMSAGVSAVRETVTLHKRVHYAKRNGQDILVPLAAASSAVVLICQSESIPGLSNGENVEANPALPRGGGREYCGSRLACVACFSGGWNGRP